MKSKKCDCFWPSFILIFLIIILFILGIYLYIKGIYYDNCDSLIDCIYKISEVGLLIVAIVSAIFACREYKLHKNNEKTQLLCHYNHRYMTDKSIKEVIKWMLENSVIDKNGDITEYVNKNGNSNLIFAKEMFMRFFEELNIQIQGGNLDKQQVKELFSYYAIKFGEIEGFRKDITDYETNWSNFKSFVNLMDSDCKNENDSKK